jgi:hypothetical protein
MNWKTRLIWLLIPITIYLSGFSVYGRLEGLYNIKIPEMIKPLEIIRSNGRPLTVTCVLLTLFFALTSINGFRETVIQKKRGDFFKDHLVLSLMAIHFLFIFKILSDFPISSSLISALLTELFSQSFFFVLALTISVSVVPLIKTEQDFVTAVESISLSGILFVFSNLVQSIINPNAVYYASNLFTGTTGNPQHAAALLCMTLPSLIFCFEQNWRRGNALKTFLFALTIFFGIYFLFRTGSRTGTITFLITSLFLLVRSTFLSSIFTFFVPIFAFFALDSFTKSKENLKPFSKISNFTTTSRDSNWSQALSNFNEYILFGVPFSGKIFFIESSWLSLWFSLGGVGFLISLVWLETFLAKFKTLLTLKNFSVYGNRKSNLVNANFIAAFIFSFGEASLLGLLTPYIIILLINVALAISVIDHDKHIVGASKA